jgi:hypothetical protein
VFVARSPNGGETFDEPTRVTASGLPTFALSPIVLSDGRLVVPFSNRARSNTGTESRPLDLSWSVTSHDGGATFSPPRFISDCGARWSGTAVDDTTGPYRDRIYWTCWDRPAEKLLLFASSDGGQSWLNPTVVARGYVQNGVVVVNRAGVMAVAWYDGRNDPRGYRSVFRCQAIFFTVSLDGGRTFLPDVKISSAENCPDTPANAEAGRRWVAGGDYFGLVAASDSRFHLLWADSRQGIYQLRTSTVTVDARALPTP